MITYHAFLTLHRQSQGQPQGSLPRNFARPPTTYTFDCYRTLVQSSCLVVAASQYKRTINPPPAHKFAVFDCIEPFQASVFKTAFRLLRNTGLAVSLGLTALAAYQGLQDAMADIPERHDRGRRLDAREREVVFCHQCHSEWYFDDHRLVCPTCEGEVTEIVSPWVDSLDSPLHYTDHGFR